MPRIPDAEIDRLKRETDLAALVRSRGVELERHGSKDLVGKCPFHADTDKPNFIVSPEKGLFHCMACGAAGNAIQFVQKFDGVSFRHAYELLAAGRPAFAAPPTAAARVGTVRRLDCPLDAGAEDAALMERVVAYYHERLMKTPAALDYLKGRGLCHEEALKTFRIGFADRTLGLRIPEGNRKDGDALRARLTALGIWRESGHEHLTGCVVLPIRDEAGRVSEMYGRRITKGLRKGTPMHLYLPGPHAGVWNLDALTAPEIILCEAPLDALTFWVNGIRNVSFIYGTQGFTDDHLDALLRRRVQRVRIAYDADEAGNKAAARDAERLAAHGVECWRVKFPWGMDANEYAQKVQPAERSLMLAVNSAEPMHGGKPGGGGGALPRAPAPPSSSSSLAAELAAGESAAKDEIQHQAGTAPAVAPPVASPAPTPQPDTPPLETRGEYVFLRLGPREYRVGGLEKNNSLEVMKVALRLRHGETFHLDSFDLLQDGQRRRFIERAAEETTLEKDLVKRDLGKLLLALERAQEARLARAVQPAGQKTPDLTPAERAEALAFLKSPDLVAQIGAAFDTCGLVGEDANRLAAYLACTSRKLDKPLAVIIQSTSAAGKSTLMEAVLAMFPEEERVKYSAMTGQSLYYLGEGDLKHKILAIVEEEGAEKASYALKLLQSEGELTIASTGKDPHTGRMETQEYHVKGPVMIFLTTTAVEIDEELLNRCLILTVDESREQTERIHTLQRKARTLEGLRLKKRKAALLALLRNAQRLLLPLDVMNPFADELTFTADRTRTRRDHEKYLTLIEAIALLHQYQRPTERDPESGAYIRVTLDDIALANRLAPELLGRSLDELPPQTRRVFDTVKAIVRERCDADQVEQRFAFISRRELRRRLGWSATQVRFHLERLRELEYIAARYGRPGAAFQYELLTDCREVAAANHIGLLDVEKLRLRQATCRENRAPVGGCREAPRQVQVVEEPALAVNLSA
jgi:DNA primase catalytic core